MINYFRTFLIIKLVQLRIKPKQRLYFEQEVKAYGVLSTGLLIMAFNKKGIIIINPNNNYKHIKITENNRNFIPSSICILSDDTIVISNDYDETINVYTIVNDKLIQKYSIKGKKVKQFLIMNNNLFCSWNDNLITIFKKIKKEIIQVSTIIEIDSQICAMTYLQSRKLFFIIHYMEV